MYQIILVTLEGTASDRAIITHVQRLAQLAGSSVVLLHVADGWAARIYGSDAISPEITEDTSYLGKIQAEFQALGIAAVSELAYGDPATEILKWAAQKRCDLIAMTAHGHKLIGDIVFGSTIDKVRHGTSIPLLVVRQGA
jgi:nucleotide-binding universal stress UspA family protein